MALRSLDNALPIASERPKKQAKVAEAAPIKKQLADAVAVNDENQAPLPPPSGDSTINYISSENLAALTDPETEIQVICCFEPKARICFRGSLIRMFLCSISCWYYSECYNRGQWSTLSMDVLENIGYMEIGCFVLV